MLTAEAMQRVRGTAGTNIAITVQRSDTLETLTVTMTRKNVVR
jgi:C-terminal processing protease CtpA/Prc